ncbi:MAG: hypothetical protein J5993_03740 [Clostridia bacterium]|nr:hypothetical protein [Clostridia bacterium]
MDGRLSQLQASAFHDEALKERLLESRREKDPMAAFCAIAEEYGIKITPFELASLGEESCAMMLRSQNGGGEIEPMGWSDDYELFFLSLGVK